MWVGEASRQRSGSCPGKAAAYGIWHPCFLSGGGARGILVLCPGLNLCPLYWKWGALTTGPPGKPLSVRAYNLRGFLRDSLSPVVPSPFRLQPSPHWLLAPFPNTWPISSFACFFKSRFPAAIPPGASLPSSFQGVLLKREFAALYLELEKSLFGLWASWHPKQRGEISITRFTVLINSK